MTKNKRLMELINLITEELNKNSYTKPVEEGKQSPEMTIGAIKAIVNIARLMNE